MEQGSAVEKKMQDIIRFYTQTSHRFHFTIYFPIGPCEETSSWWGAREGRRADSRASRRGARFRAPALGRAKSHASRWARRSTRLEVGAQFRAPGRRRAGSRAFLLTPSAFPLDFWQCRYIFFGRVYVLFMYRVYCREATSHTAQRNRRGAPNYVSRVSAGAISAIYMEAEARHLRRKI